MTDFSGATKEQIDIVCNSLCEYFDKFFMSTLLYHCERNYIKTYASELEHGEYSKYFGAEHFLRLLCMLFSNCCHLDQYPSLVYHTDLCERDISVICLILCELFRYVLFMCFKVDICKIIKLFFYNLLVIFQIHYVYSSFQ